MRPTRQPDGILAASVCVLALIFPNAPVANADDDGYDYYERPPYQGGLIDSYDCYNPQLLCIVVCRGCVDAVGEPVPAWV